MRPRLRLLAAVVIAVVGLGGCAAPPDEAAQMSRQMRRAPADGDLRISGREFLLPGHTESRHPAPYGLYSYLLLGARPSEQSRPRYVAAIQTFLELLQPIQGLERSGVSRAALNVTYVPIEDPTVIPAVESGDPRAAELILRHYDYARAQALLARVPGGPHLDGPYFVSHREPLGSVARLTSGYGWVDASTAPAARAPRWVQVFLRETARQDYAQPLTTTRVWTSILDELDKAGEGAPEVLKAFVFWVR
jgi:hypothetical protein